MLDPLPGKCLVIVIFAKYLAGYLLSVLSTVGCLVLLSSCQVDPEVTHGLCCPSVNVWYCYLSQVVEVDPLLDVVFTVPMSYVLLSLAQGSRGYSLPVLSTVRCLVLLSSETTLVMKVTLSCSCQL